MGTCLFLSRGLPRSSEARNKEEELGQCLRSELADMPADGGASQPIPSAPGVVWMAGSLELPHRHPCSGCPYRVCAHTAGRRWGLDHLPGLSDLKGVCPHCFGSILSFFAKQNFIKTHVIFALSLALQYVPPFLY